MQLKRLLSIIFAMLLIKQSIASKVVTVADGDWDEPSVWSENAIPSNPDTIIIRYYITFSRDLVIQAPTVLIVEQGGTLCGDYLLDVSCGAKFYNYYRLYVGKLNVRDGINYYELHAKSNMVVMGCSTPGFGTGYKNLPPYASTYVWPVNVLCKTSTTHWPREAEVGVASHYNDPGISIFPNPINLGTLKIATFQNSDFVLLDIYGRKLNEGFDSKTYEINMTDYPRGLYLLNLKQGNHFVSHKIVKE
jgi:hypothetical protein